jgi:hypothetical protein
MPRFRLVPRTQKRVSPFLAIFLITCPCSHCIPVFLWPAEDPVQRCPWHVAVPNTTLDHPFPTQCPFIGYYIDRDGWSQQLASATSTKLIVVVRSGYWCHIFLNHVQQYMQSVIICHCVVQCLTHTDQRLWSSSVYTPRAIRLRSVRHVYYVRSCLCPVQRAPSFNHRMHAGMSPVRTKSALATESKVSLSHSSLHLVTFTVRFR